MLLFGGHKFDATLKKLLKKKSFGQIYSQVFTPLLSSARTHWQTWTVDPCHKHFISERIKQTLVIQTADSKKKITKKGFPEFVLFLTSAEIHEIRLLYAN